MQHQHEHRRIKRGIGQRQRLKGPFAEGHIGSGRKPRRGRRQHRRRRVNRVHMRHMRRQRLRQPAGAAAEGTYVSFFSPDPNLVPEAQPYNEIYTAATGNEFGAFGGASAFTTYIGLQAIKVCADGGDLSRACVVDALTNINLESSPLGLPVAFGEGNQIAGSRFFLFQVKDGKFTLVQ